MSQNTKEQKSGNRSNGKKRTPWRSGGNKGQKSSVSAKYKCPICNEGVKELGNAIDFKGQGPAHFDCVLRELTKGENLAPGEKIAYIGSGRFGVILSKKNDAGGPFTLIREIELEDSNKNYSWRDEKKIDVSIE